MYAQESPFEHSTLTDQALVARKMKYQQQLQQIQNRSIDYGKAKKGILIKGRKSFDLSNSHLGMHILSQQQSMQISRLSDTFQSASHANEQSLLHNHTEPPHANVSQTLSATSHITDRLQNKLDQKITHIKNTNRQQVRLKTEEEREPKYQPKLTYQEKESSFLFNRKDYSALLCLSPQNQKGPASPLQLIHQQTIKECKEYRHLERQMDSLMNAEKKKLKETLRREMDPSRQPNQVQYQKEQQFRQVEQERQSQEKRKQQQRNKEHYQFIKAAKQEKEQPSVGHEETTRQRQNKHQANWQLRLIKEEKEKLKRKIGLLSQR